MAVVCGKPSLSIVVNSHEDNVVITCRHACLMSEAGLGLRLFHRTRLGLARSGDQRAPRHPPIVFVLDEDHNLVAAVLEPLASVLPDAIVAVCRHGGRTEYIHMLVGRIQLLEGHLGTGIIVRSDADVAALSPLGQAGLGHHDICVEKVLEPVESLSFLARQVDRRNDVSNSLLCLVLFGHVSAPHGLVEMNNPAPRSFPIECSAMCP
jgi:hypothetical protein